MMSFRSAIKMCFFIMNDAFVNTAQLVQQLRDQLEKQCQIPFISIEVKNSEISIEEAVKTYLFNSQIVTLPDQTMALIAPQECQTSPSVKRFHSKIINR